MSWPKPPPAGPSSAVIVTRPIVVTVAIRMPAMIAGNASGRSIDTSSRGAERPMPRAASRISGGTESRPARMLRTRMSSV